MAEPNRIDLHVSDVAVRQWGIEEGLPQGPVSRSTVDRNGHVWLATFGGLVRFDGRRLETLTVHRIPVLVDNSVTAVYADPDGSVCFGTPRGTIGRLRDGKLVDTLPAGPTGADRTIADVVRRTDGSLIVSVGGKLQRYGAGGWIDDVNSPRVLSLLTTARDRPLLFATASGVQQFTPHGVAALSSPPIDSTSMNIRVYRDRRGRVWVGQRSGLSVQTSAGTQRIAGVPGPMRVLAANPADSAEGIWVGSGNDLYRIRLGPQAFNDVPPCG